MALEACRKQRIDMNVVYDLVPQRINNNPQEFVKQVKDVENFNLFLSQLRDEDTTRTLFRFLSHDDDERSSQEVLRISISSF